jgi:pyrroline-5-carboxylate reductase
MPKNRYTVVGTNIDEVKQQNAQSGLSYNQAKELLAKTTKGHGTAVYSNTDSQAIKNNLQQP